MVSLRSLHPWRMPEMALFNSLLLDMRLVIAIYHLISNAR